MGSAEGLSAMPTSVTPPNPPPQPTEPPPETDSPSAIVTPEPPPKPPSVPPALDKPITWRTVARLGLGFAAEYALLALIEDAPVAVKIATVLCATGALAALESEDWLNRKRERLFTVVISLLGAIYFCFLAYAGGHALNRLAVRQGLERIYVQSGKWFPQSFPVDPGNGLFDPAAVTQFANEVSNWEQSSAIWIGEHLGETARDRFLDASSHGSFS